MAKIKISPEMLNLLAMSTNRLAQRRQDEYLDRMNKEFQVEQEQNRQEFARSFRVEDWDYTAAQDAADTAAYNEAMAARYGQISPTVETVEAPSLPQYQEPPPTVYGSGTIKPPGQFSLDPGNAPVDMPPPTTPQEIASPSLPSPGTELVSPAADRQPYSAEYLTPPPDLSPEAQRYYYEEMDPYLESAFTRSFTGADTKEAGEEAARDYFFANFPTWRTMNDEQKAAEIANMVNSAPQGVDKDSYLSTLSNLYGVETIAHETPEQTTKRQDAERMMDVVGPIDTVWTLRHVYRMTPEVIAETTGKSLEEVNKILETRPRTYDPQASGSQPKPSAEKLRINFASLSPAQQRQAVELNPNMTWNENFSEIEWGTPGQTDGKNWIEDFWTDIYRLAGGVEVDLTTYTPEQQQAIESEAIAIVLSVTGEQTGTGTE